MRLSLPWMFALGSTFGFLAGVTLRDALDLYRKDRRESRGRHANR